MARQAIDPLEEEREQAPVFTFTYWEVVTALWKSKLTGGLWNACQKSYFRMEKRSVVKSGLMPDLTTLYIVVYISSTYTNECHESLE